MVREEDFKLKGNLNILFQVNWTKAKFFERQIITDLPQKIFSLMLKCKADKFICLGLRFIHQRS